MFLALTESENKVKEKHNSVAYMLNLPLTLTMLVRQGVFQLN